MTHPFRAGLGVALLALAGCGGGATDVTGTVTYQGKPVVFGTVQVIGSDGLPKSGPIQPDGTFKVSGVKLGPAKVTVSSPKPPGSASAPRRGGRDQDDEDRRPVETPASPAVIAAWVQLPEKYGDPEKTDLKVDIKSGQPLDLDLK
jgi:hypothetical protein